MQIIPIVVLIPAKYVFTLYILSKRV